MVTHCPQSSPLQVCCTPLLHWISPSKYMPCVRKREKGEVRMQSWSMTSSSTCSFNNLKSGICALMLPVPQWWIWLECKEVMSSRTLYQSSWSPHFTVLLENCITVGSTPVHEKVSTQYWLVRLDFISLHSNAKPSSAVATGRAKRRHLQMCWWRVGRIRDHLLYRIYCSAIWSAACHANVYAYGVWCVCWATWRYRVTQAYRRFTTHKVRCYLGWNQKRTTLYCYFTKAMNSVPFHSNFFLNFLPRFVQFFTFPAAANYLRQESVHDSRTESTFAFASVPPRLHP